MGLNNNEIRLDFPFFSQNPNLVYFDNAATTQKPQCVIDAINDYYSSYNANVHRGVYTIAEKATYEFESSREYIAKFIGAERKENLIITSGATGSINLVAHGWAKHNLKTGDHILITQMEHHSNIVPWQIIANDIGIKIDYIPINNNNELDLSNLDKLITSKTKLVSIVHQSNVLGVVNDIKRIIDAAHQKDAVVLVDGAQSIVHQRIDVKELDCDFFVFSGHKIYGPTGVGILYAKENCLQKMKPFMGGGEMIDLVTEQEFTPNRPPWKFEAGTPAIAQVVALKKAIQYINNLGIENISKYEQSLTSYTYDQLNQIEGMNIYSPKNNIGPVITFNIKGVHSYDLTKILDEMKIAIRSGHHCAQPLMRRMGISSSNRISLSLYNTSLEIDFFIDSLNKALTIL